MELLNRISGANGVSFDLRGVLRKYGILFILLAMVGALLIVSETFRTPQNFINVLQQISINGIIAIGMTLVIISAGIDLSVGAFIAVASVTCGSILYANPDHLFLAIFVSIVVCALGGMFNGYFVAKYNMFPFVSTLASLLIFRGVAYIISDGKSFVLHSEGFKQIGQGKIFGVIPVSIVIFAVIALLGHLLLAKTKYGRYLYAAGGNLNAAIASGINVFNVKLVTYVIMGVCSGIAGIILSSRINAGQPSIGTSYELDAIAATIIGGTSFNGGIGTIFGTVIGVLIIGVINNGMNLLGVSSYYQQVVRGGIILLAVLLDMYTSNRSSK